MGTSGALRICIAMLMAAWGGNVHAQWRDATSEAARNNEPKSIDITGVLKTVDEAAKSFGPATDELPSFPEYRAAREADYQKIGAKMAADMLAIQHDVKVLNGYIPGLDAQQKVAAATCLNLATPVLKESMTGMQLVKREHDDVNDRLRQATASTDTEKMMLDWSREFNVVLQMSLNLAEKTGKISHTFRQCLLAYKVPIL